MISEKDIKDKLPIIIDAYCEVFGEEYREIITKRLDDLEYFIYDNVTSGDIGNFESYYNFLLTCKQRELSLKFLESIGIDVSKNKEKSLAYELDKELNNLLDIYIGGYSFNFAILKDSNFDGVLAFKTEIPENIIGKVKFLNYIKSPSTPTITLENIGDFLQSNEFKLLKPKIDLAIKSYDSILSEYESYKKSLEPFMKDIIASENLKEEIYEAKSEELLKAIYKILPRKIKHHMRKNNITIRDLFDSCDLLQEKSNIEYFSEEDNNTLKDKKSDANKKYFIEQYRKQFFSSLGLDINLNTDSYDQLIKQRKIKKMIPSEELIEKIIKLKEEKLSEAQLEYYSQKYDLKSYPRDVRKNAFGIINNNAICISHRYDIVFNKQPIKSYCTLFLTLPEFSYGKIDYIILHELCHCIETNIYESESSCGFDTCISKSDLEKNQYDKRYRKYERLNENITDIFALEALNVFRNMDLYMFEDKKIVKDYAAFTNTSQITRSLLNPFVNRYKKQIIKARITGNYRDLFDLIGKDNFEDLNDVINKLDYIIKSKSIDSLKDISIKNPDDHEIFNQLKRANLIYINMKKYKSNHIEDYEYNFEEIFDLLDFDVEK